ncbi:hypothetical protein HNR42_000712 [Deinobacterium chartae]|uniref:HTH arsR-type domain-containing protein n=1 Tax=Deinobacterium chartae TaxID=521158 RepID=A0A841HZ84_9DEIO|nr:metalloregulator ArsR/SmtB family transcription factor [Deinobacterium chartae]MBB6097298.1 hypothetical protein [Deinobacterium chartae]
MFRNVSRSPNPSPPLEDSALLEVLKALADPGRLRIIGLLAHGPSSVEGLAAELELSLSTTSHHLSRLSGAGLVEARARGHYSMYSLVPGPLEDAARRLLDPGSLAHVRRESDQDLFERKVLERFTDAAGRITAFPRPRRKFLVLLRHVQKAFEPGRRYSEREVNDTLLRFNDDTATLRRGLIEHGLMLRAGGGGDYWLPPQP